MSVLNFSERRAFRKCFFAILTIPILLSVTSKPKPDFWLNNSKDISGDNVPYPVTTTTILSEDFETCGHGSRYTEVNSHSDGGSDYFVRTDGTAGNTTVNCVTTSTTGLSTFSGMSNSYYYVGEDIDDGTTKSDAGYVFFDDIDISGYTNLKVKGLFGFITNGADNDQHIEVMVDIDNSGSYTLIGAFKTVGGADGVNVSQDTDLDGAGDGTVLTSTLAEYTFNVGATGSLMDLRVVVSTNTGSDEFAFDLIQVEGVGSSNSAPVIGGTSAGQEVNDNATISPFSGITVTDSDGDDVTATITLDDNAKGTITGADSGSGPYTMTSRTPAAMETALKALVFNPTDNRTSTNETTTFTVEVSDGTDSDDDNNTTVISNAVGPTISAVSIPNSSMNVGDVVTAIITVSSDTDNYTSGSGGISGTIGGFSLGSLSKLSNTSYSATFTVTEGGTDVAAGSSIPVSITLTDSGGKGGNTYTTPISQGSDAIDANSPTISNVSMPNTPLKVGDAITISIVAGETGLSLNSGTVNGVAVTGFTDNLNNTYRATYTVVEGNADRAAGDDIPVSFILTDAAGNNSSTYATAISQGSDAIDANSPTISSVSIPNSPAKVGEAITVTISAGETGLSLNSGTVNGVTVTGFTDNANNTYSATYTVTEGNADRAAGTDIPVSFILNDAAGNSSSTYATAISQGSDAIDANSPTISSVSIPNSAAKVGDAITVTITAGETGLSLNSGTVNGVTVTGFTDNSDNTYSATYTVVEGNTDRAAGENIPVAFILNDGAGNSSSTFVTAISQGSDAIDANSPASPVVSSPSSASRVNAASQTISGTHGEDGATINAYADSDNNGVADNSTSLGSAVVSGGAWSFSVNLSADTDNNFVVVAEDGAGNQSSAVDVSTITEDSTGPNITSLGLNNSNAFIEVYFNEAVYSTNGGSGALQASDLVLSLSGGAASVVSNVVLKNIDGTTDLAGGEDRMRVSFDLDATANGGETITVNFADGSSVFDVAGNAAAASQSNNTRTLNDLVKPNITAVSLAADNSYIDVTFNEAVYNDNCLGGALATSDFDLKITGGSASLNAMTSVTKTDGNAASGGETSLRINFTLTGTPDGSETIEIDLQSNEVFDQNGLVGDADQTSNNTATLNDKAAPTVLEMSSDVNNSSFKVGANINIYVQYSEEVFVTGTPQLTLETGSTDRTIDYVDRSSSTLRFVYTVQAGDVSSDLDVQSTSALTLNGGTIKDAAGNNAVLTLPVDPDGSALTAKNLVIDGVAPTVTSVTSSSADGSFKIGDQVNVQVVFSEAVTVSDYTQLQLQLETGDSDYYIASQSGSGTTTINFIYTVQSGTESSDLEYLATNSLEVSLSGSVKDAVGNDANLTLPAIGGGNSLSDNKALVIDGIVPSFENSTPTVSNIKQTEFDLSLDLDEAGTFYYVVLANDASAPTSAEVKAGTGASGEAASNFGSASAAPDFFTTALGGVGVTSASTAYDLYVVAEDAAGNLQSSPAKVDITTIAAPSVTLSVDNSSIAENGGTATLTATLSGASSQDVTVSLSYSGTAINGTEYNSSASSSITITAGQTSADAGTIITAINNNTDAANKSIDVAIISVSNGTEDGDQEVSITIADDDSSPVITASQSFSVDEDATDATVVGNVLATDADAGTTFSNWSITAGNSDGVFAINSSTGQLVINDKTNLDFETTESYTLTLTVTDGANLSAAEDVTIQVNDLNDNDPVVTASQTFSVNENVANSTSVGTVAATDADANTSLSGWFITAGNGDGVFAINSSTGEITIANNTNLDYDVTSSYSLTVTVTDGTNTSSGQTVTININKVSGITITEDSGSTSTTEAGGTDSFTVVLDVQPSSDVVLSVVSGDIGEGTVSPATLTFTSANWNTPQTVTVTGVDDDIIDGTVNYDVTVSVVDGSSDDNYDDEADQTVNVGNTDNDVAGFTVIQSSGSTSTTEAGGTDSFTVELDAEPSSNVVIDVTSGDTGEATASVASLTFTSANWDTPQTVTMTGVDDDIIDGTQTFNITLSIDDSSSDDDFDPLGDQTVSLDNIDDDVAGFTVTQSGGSTEVSESGTTDDFTVVLDAEPASNVVINVTSGDTGEATISAASLTFTTANWDTPQTVTVTGTDDSDLDGSQTTTITLSIDAGSSDDDFDALGDQSVSVTTTDDDTPIIAFASTSSSGAESVSSASLTVNLDKTSPNAVTVDYAITGTATGSGTDYTLVGGTLTFTAGESSKTIDISGIVDDAFDEENETVIVTLSNPTGGDLGTNTVHTYTINDNDPTPQVTLSYSSQSIAEAAGTTTITATLSAVSGRDVTVNLHLLTGTATLTNDFTLSSNTILIAAGNTTGTVTITAVQDFFDEEFEYLNLAINTVNNGSIDPLGGSVSITINDDDVAGFTVTELGGSIEVSETGTTGDFTVVLRSQPTSNVVINVTSGDTGEATVSSSFLTFTPANWNTPQTITVTGVDDADADGTQVTTITLAIDDASSDDVFDGLLDQTFSVSTADDDDGTAPSGYSITFDDALIGGGEITTSTFTFAGAEVGATYNYSLSSDNGGLAVTGSGTISTATDQITLASLSAVNDGTLTLSVTLTDPANNVGTAVTATSILDATRPEVPAVTSVSNDTGSSSSDGVTSDASPDVSGTAEANSTVEVFVGGNSVGTTTADASGNWTLAYSGGTDLSDGTISVTATATDAAGNTSIASVAVNVTIDTTAPSAPSVTSISADTGVNGTDGKTNDNTLTISGTLPESNVTVEVFIDGISVGQAVMGLSTFSLDYSGTELEDGEYEITAKATDVAGNTGALSSVFNLTIDTTAPDAPTIDLDPIYDTGFSDSDNLTNSTSLKFTGVAEIGSDVEVFVNNVSQGVTAPDVITGEWFTIVSSLPQDQNIEVKAVATDYVGNTGAASEVLTVTIDNTVADPAFSPADNAVGVLPSANLVLTFEEEVRKSGNTISIRRSSDNSILESFDVSSDKVSVNGSVVTINPDNALLPAATEFYVVIGQGAFVDNAGNDYMGISNNTTWTFTTIDAAVVTAVSVPGAETYGIGDNLDFELTFSQEVTMTGSPTIDLTIGSETVTASLQGSVTSSTTATFRYTVKEGDLDADGISIGSTINLNGGTFKDAFDIDALADLNNVPSTAAILVDGVKPAPTITSDAGSLTNAAFTATFTYDEAVSGLELGDISVTNGTASNFTNVTAGTVWSATIIPAADGETTVTLNADVANDLAGNASKAGNTVSTTFDGTAPTVTSITRAESDQIPTGTATRSFTVVFSEDVTGVDVSDFEVVTTGSATASINTVSATDAKTYTVNVNGISGEGTIGLNAKDDDSILDAATNPLGGTFTGEIYATNFVPTDISMSSSSIQENNAVGAEIGTFTTTDADAGDSFTYSLVSGTGDSDNGSFTISADKLLAAEVFDFETKDSYSIRVKTEDGFGGSYEEALTISITNEGEAIIVISGDGVFDQTILGLSSTKNWTVENQGDVATEVRIISSSQGFSFAPGSVQVNPGETKNITAVFRPREARAYTGVVVFNFDITDNIKDNVVEIGLSGEGVIVTGTDNGQISEEQINVFPNPATTSITIDLSELHGLPVDIQMVNPTGVSKLEKEGYDKPELTIDITNFESGLYIIQFSNERSLVRKKVLIRR